VTRRRPSRAVTFALATSALIGLLLLEPAKPVASARAMSPSTTTSTSTTTTTTTPRPDAVIPPVTDGLAPVLTRIATKLPVVFLGIDDGANKEPFELQMMQDNDVHASLFLADSFIHRNATFFASFVPAGNLVENHSLSHRNMPSLSYAEQVKEICGEADAQEQQFGRRPILFRPPGGAYNTNTRRAAAACGMRAVVNWIAKANAGSMQYQLGHGLRPGDIVLMHFRPEFRSDMQAFLDAVHAAGLHTELLEDWVLQDRQQRWHGLA
jgi:hypothetical protein